jgi:putative phage-type endonuclease
MSTVVRVAQGSPEWHEHRRKYRNASETPVVLGVSPWKTPYQLWQLKLGLIEQQVTPVMQRGTDLEPVARAAYERQAGCVMQPLVVIDGEYSASLDGMTLGGDRLLEVKCPFKGRDSTLWKTVEAGRLPEHYQWQVEHQLMVTSAAVADVFVFDGTEGILL